MTTKVKRRNNKSKMFISLLLIISIMVSVLVLPKTISAAEYMVAFHENLPDSNQMVRISGSGELSINPDEGIIILGNKGIDYDFSSPDYVLNGWNTKPDGTGIALNIYGYHEGNSFEVNEDLDLYAQWTKAYTIILHENAKDSDQTVQIAGIGELSATDSEATFSSDEYHYSNHTTFAFNNAERDFLGWNTKADGSGTDYPAGQPFTVDADMDLYARWESIVTFHDNSEEDKTVCLCGSGQLSLTDFSAYIVDSGESILFNFTKDGYMLVGWNSSADGTGTFYPVYSDVLLDRDMELYAQWSEEYTITMHADLGGSGSNETKEVSVPLGGYFKVVGGKNPGVCTYYPESSAVSCQNSFEDITRTDAAFDCWIDDDRNVYRSGSTLYGPVTDDVDLYAVMTSNTVSVTFNFGTSGSVTRTFARGAAIPYEYKETGQYQVGWSEDLTKQEYYDELQFDMEMVIADKDKTFYPVYISEGRTKPYLYDSVSSFYYSVLNNNTVVVQGYNGSLAKLRIPNTIGGKTVVAYSIYDAFNNPEEDFGTPSKIESLVYPDYIPHVKIHGSDAGRFTAGMFPELKVLYFENELPDILPNDFNGLEVTAYYPASWETVPSSTFGSAKNITWVPLIDVSYTERCIDMIPDVNQLTLNDKPVVEDARAAYESLNNEEQIRVNQDKLAHLVSAEAKIAELEAAQGITCVVTVTSVGDGVNGSIAPVYGGGIYHPGETVTVGATIVNGFTFVGWTVDGTIVSTDTEYTFIVEGDTDLVATYQVKNEVSYSLKITGMDFKVNGIPQNNVYYESFKAGTDVVLSYYGNDTFLRWENSSNQPQSVSPSVTLTMNRNYELRVTTVRSIPGDETNGYYAYVEFISPFDQVMSASTWSSKDNYSAHSLPGSVSKSGYTFAGWTMDKETAAGTKDIITSIDAEHSYIGLTALMEVIDSPRTVTVYDADGNSTEKQVNLGRTVTLKAGNVSGKTFKCWALNAEGTVPLSYSVAYSFKVTTDISVYAIYVNAGESVTALPVAASTGAYGFTDGGKNKLSFTGNYDVPEGYTVVEYGLLYGTKATEFPDVETAEGKLVYESENTYVKKQASTYRLKRDSYEYLINVTGHLDNYVYAKAYLVVINSSTGEQEVYYGKMMYGTYNSLTASGSGGEDDNPEW